MTIKEDLHQLVDRLDDHEARAALDLLKQLVPRGSEPAEMQVDALLRRMKPLMVDGRAFFNAPVKDAEMLAREQGVKPVERIDDLFGDFWPDDEDPEEFRQAVRGWRNEA